MFDAFVQECETLVSRCKQQKQYELQKKAEELAHAQAETLSKIETTRHYTRQIEDLKKRHEQALNSERTERDKALAAERAYQESEREKAVAHERKQNLAEKEKEIWA